MKFKKTYDYVSFVSFVSFAKGLALAPYRGLSLTTYTGVS